MDLVSCVKNIWIEDQNLFTPKHRYLEYHFSISQKNVKLQLFL